MQKSPVEPGHRGNDRPIASALKGPGPDPYALIAVTLLAACAPGLLPDGIEVGLLMLPLLGVVSAFPALAAWLPAIALGK